jgi:uncharacterized protein YutE (UPF0331/DUF86 family)
MSFTSIEAGVLENVAENLKADGFAVYVQPSGSIVPPFLGRYRPDALAFRGEKRLVVEVVKNSEASREKLQAIREKLSGQAGWELFVVWATPEESNVLEMPPPPRLEEAIQHAEALVSEKKMGAALLLAWAALEAAARANSPEAFARPQPTARLLEVLATEGQITPSEADCLRKISRKRDLVAHGGFQTPISAEEVLEVLKLTKSAFRETA